ncbi:unnamed protein product [Lepeophtheirus salmonis]|uniref:(salmon louse) hypothetical protein n=1 Tax=Lepeophtheirus salmonis TaxID=72036 RepID=A0A7R8CM06_LEPSM|nr:unnamed protein product [Lepeophtheirus salmonis]CAF2862247.1 unnamed protein product [Lepeophtheirus salmonis]
MRTKKTRTKRQVVALPMAKSLNDVVWIYGSQVLKEKLLFYGNGRRSYKILCCQILSRWSNKKSQYGDIVFNNRNDDSKWKGTCEIIGKDGKVYFVRHGGCRIRCHVCMLQKRCEDTKKGCKTKMFQCRRQRNVVEARIEDENAIASHVEDISNSNEKDVSSKHDENPNVGDKRKRGCPTNGKYRRFYNIRYHCSGEECCVDIDTWKEVDDLLLPSGGR